MNFTRNSDGLYTKNAELCVQMMIFLRDDFPASVRLRGLLPGDWERDSRWGHAERRAGVGWRRLHLHDEGAVSTQNHGFCTGNDGVCTENAGFCTANAGLCTANDGLCTENDGLCTEIDGLCTAKIIMAGMCKYDEGLATAGDFDIKNDEFYTKGWIYY